MAENTRNENMKAQKFRQLAERRLERAVHATRLIVPLADRSRYEYTEEQTKYIVKILKESVKSVENAFLGKIEKEISLP